MKKIASKLILFFWEWNYMDYYTPFLASRAKKETSNWIYQRWNRGVEKAAFQPLSGDLFNIVVVKDLKESMAFFNYVALFVLHNVTHVFRYRLIDRISASVEEDIREKG